MIRSGSPRYTLTAEGMAGFGRPDLTRTLQMGVLVIFDALG
jgi:hypothetical protein